MVQSYHKTAKSSGGDSFWRTGGDPKMNSVASTKEGTNMKGFDNSHGKFGKSYASPFDGKMSTLLDS